MFVAYPFSLTSVNYIFPNEQRERFWKSEQWISGIFTSESQSTHYFYFIFLLGNRFFPLLYFTFFRHPNIFSTSVFPSKWTMILVGKLNIHSAKNRYMMLENKALFYLLKKNSWSSNLLISCNVSCSLCCYTSFSQLFSSSLGLLGTYPSQKLYSICLVLVFPGIS